MSPAGRRLSIAFFWLAATQAVAMIGGTATIWTYTRNLETGWLGPMVAPLVLPSIIFYLLLDLWRPHSWSKHIGFVIPLAAIMATLVWTIWDVSQHPFPSDGSDQILWAIVITIAGSAFAAYCSLWFKR